ncbi:M1 family aminopeptidase [Flavobacterium sp. RSB2_4_14]|uniref:ABC transporter permease/M1 family aminopeptidase n=1 Tax=Flavobacterium sp. RSB2_4_14 TaxID=3447665 RepID=UPI003F32765A
MFGTIFTFELKRWLKNPSFYIYVAIFFGLSLLLMGSSLGIFDNFKTTTSSNAMANSPIALNGMLNGLSVFIYFLLPSIVGASVYRDFKYNMHTILFSYPFSKWDYLMSKFLSSLLVVIIITLFVGLGAFLASFLPGVNPDLLGPHRFIAYIQSYLIFIIPNLIFYGVIVFSMVTITRNISVGFITVILLLFIQSIISSFTQDADNRYIVALLEPFGSDALDYYTKYWTVYEKNENLLPYTGVVLYNRLIWLGISTLILGLMYRYFSFTQTALTLGRSRNNERVTKNNFGGITKINLPNISFDFSTKQNLKTAWSLSNVDFKFIVRNWVFISIVIVGMLFILITSLSAGQFFGTETYPVTWQMLEIPGATFSLFINLLTFLFSGILIHRSATARMNHLIDVTPTPNWVLLSSKFIAIVKMQIVLLSVIMISGILFQIYKGYYNFEIGHYLFELYGIELIHCIIWALLAIFIQTLFKNYLLGFFVLLLLSIGLSFLPAIGVEQQIYQFNSDPGFDYSDMNGYGHGLKYYYLYKFYWLALGLVFFALSLLFWTRGLGQSVKLRFADAINRMKKQVVIPMTLSFLVFLGIGSAIYYENNIVNESKTGKEQEEEMAQWEKKYKKYENKAQPRITDVKVDMDLFPEERNFVANGTYTLKNKTSQTIDTIFVNHGKYTKVAFKVKTKLVSKDTVMNFDMYRLEQPLMPGDSIQMSFTVKNKPNDFFNDNSPVIYNGTFLNNSMFPSIGYSDQGELTDDDVRKKYGLKPKDRMATPMDSIARRNTYISSDADWITFETTVSTAGDQTAIAPGYLTKKWTKDGRNYFHYKMDRKMLNFYAFNSAKYEVKKDKWKNVNIEIYYHKGHEYNVGRMIAAVKKSLDYYTTNFSPYQHKQVRIIEFPKTGGGFAQSFANTIPFSEAIGFIAAVDDENPDAVDYPFAVTSHEVAHQWWAHQVIGANVQGATLLSESLSEYSSLKVLEHTYGKSQMRKFLKDALDSYLQGRTFESKKEQPLMFNENQQYIHYNKGSLVLYALSDFIGEKKMNDALKGYIKKVAYQEAPYTNSIELVNELKAATPDSLQYLINDMFETITLYDNRVSKATSKKLPNGKYQVDIEFEVTKYKADDTGKRIFKDKKGKTLTYTKKGDKFASESYPLNDYTEIGVFCKQTVKGEKRDKELYLKKIKINKINNSISIIVNEKPTEVGVDPYNKLIDTNSDDNRREL